MNNNNSNADRVLKELFMKPSSKFYIRELARLARLNPNTIINITNELEKQKIIKREAKKHVVEISLNFENKEVIWKKRLFNLNAIYSSGIIDFLAEEYSPQSISLTGDYSKGEDSEKSEIDIVVISSKKNIVKLEKFEKILGKKINLLLISDKIGKIPEEFFNDMLNSVVLYGRIENKIWGGK